MVSCRMASFRLGLFLLVSLLIPGWASNAHANGSYSHIHISQLAVSELPPGPIQTLLSDPLYAPMMEAGSMFPDSGYAISSPYGEEAHWPPFVRAYQEWLTEEYQGDFSSVEAKQNLAFFFGLASHGVADQTYDFMMLTRSEEVDGPLGDVDREADYFIVIDENVQLFTESWAPFAELPAILTTSVDYGSNPSVSDISEATLMDGMGRMEFVIFIQRRAAYNGYVQAWQTYPWLGTHIYNPDANGSLPHVAKLVARSWEALYRRVLETASMDTDLVVATVPEDGAMNFPVDPSESVTLTQLGVVFGYGIKRDQLSPLMRLVDEEGNTVPTSFHTPYNTGIAFFAMLRPTETLQYDHQYRVEISAGVENLIGEESTVPYTYTFRTRCAPDSLASCPPLPPPLVAGPIPTEPPPVEEPDMGVDQGTVPPVDMGTPPPSGGGGCSVVLDPTPTTRLGVTSLGLLLGTALHLRRRRRVAA